MDTARRVSMVFAVISASLFICAFASSAHHDTLLEPLRNRKIEPSTEWMKDAQIVSFVNERQKYWRAALHPRLSAYTQDVRVGLMGVKYTKKPVAAMRRESATKLLNVSVPAAFDARAWWPQCARQIGHVRDQSSCGSCWAVAAAETFSDRICIASKGTDCQGGYPYEAWQYFVQNGIVSGGDFKGDGCKPYPFPPCHNNDTHEEDVCKNGMFHTPECEEKCTNKEYNCSYESDKIHALTSYGISNSEEAIKKELMTYGPIEHTAGPLAGGHAVKLIGWGTDEVSKLPYWSVVNSWGEDWGEKGFFKILRGLDECGIESGAVAGIPKL